MFVPLLMLAQSVSTSAAAPALPPASVAPTGSLQAAFDAATRAYETRQWREAVDLFDALEARLKGKAQPKVLATIALRRGLALKRLDQDQRAAMSLHAGLSGIAIDDPALRDERLDGVYALTDLLLRQSNYTGAQQVVREGRGGARTPHDELRLAVLGLRSTMFELDDRAAGYAEQAQRLVAAMPDLDKRTRADVDTLRARFLLNRGQNAAGYDLLKKALARQGGLDMKVNLNEVVTRSDLAIAALINKDPDRAREYLAYTGAGRITESPFGTASFMTPPPCGGAANLSPEDGAIVEFGIDGMGAVFYAQTVYMSRPSSAGAKAFADAVLGWSWQAAALTRIPDFYRALTRIELRCSNAIDRPSTNAAFDDARKNYVTEKLTFLPSVGVSAAALPAIRAELARRQATPNDPVVPALMIAISMNPGTSPEEAREMLQRAQNLLPADAPVLLKASVAFDAIVADGRTERMNVTIWRNALRTLLARPDFAADPEVAGTLRLAIARAAYQKPPPPDAIELVTAVADDSRLSKNSPLKTAALLQLATLQSQAKQIGAANATFARTGLTADQCALLDTPPAVLRSNVDGADYPMEAKNWGFEGWVRFEQDILADGRSENTRAIIAYPPFVFRDAATKMGANIRYQPTFRPGSTKGCTANQQSIRFMWAR